jgi:hypothetical protein
MAKQHRMAVMTAACVGGAIEAHINASNYCLWSALAIVAAGSLWTTFGRARSIVHELERR